MKKRMRFLLVACGLTGLVTGLLSCRQVEVAAPKTTPVNQLSMQVNNQPWSPYQPPTDPCKATYNGQYGEINYGDGRRETQYLIRAYRDSTGRADVYSHNALTLQVMGVDKPGVYVLKGTWKANFMSHAVFGVYSASDSIRKRYVNRPDRRPFTVVVNEIIPDEKAFIPGITGTFSGVLYNEDNSSDSLIIDQGNFNLRYMDGYNCGY